MKGQGRVTSGGRQDPLSALRARLLRTALSAGISLVLALTLVTGPLSSPAVADPPLTVADAKAQVDRLEVEAEALDQQALAVKLRLTAGSKALTLTQKAVRQQAAKVTRVRQQVGQVALAQFQNRTMDTTAKLFLTQDTGGFLNQIATVARVSESQNSVLQDYQTEQAHLVDLERSAKVDVTTLQSADQEFTRLRSASRAKITESKAVLARLTRQERDRMAAKERAAEQAAKRAADAAAKAAAEAKAAAAAKAAATAPAKADPSGNSGPSSAGTHTAGSNNSGSGRYTPGPTTTMRSTGKGAIALAFAKKQLGKPYVFGAEGPNSYDCSGLTSAAWRAAGISIPRTSSAQSLSAGQPVAKADLQPGDLVFFYHPVSHVALYVGNGIVLHAPRPGKVVTFIQMSYMPYAGARRPG